MPDEPTPQIPPEEQARAFEPAETAWIEGDHGETHNPDGVTVSNHDYWPKTQEEKAELMNVEMSEIIDVPENEAYPDGAPMDEAGRVEFLKSVHTPQELTPEEDRWAQDVANLAAGGSIEGGAAYSEPEEPVEPPEEPEEEPDGAA